MLFASNAECHRWYHWSRYSLDKPYDYSYGTEGIENLQDLKEEAVLKVTAVFRFQWHSIAPHFDVCKETNTAIEQNGYECTLNSIKLVQGT